MLSACNLLEKYTDCKEVKDYIEFMYGKLMDYVDLDLEKNGLLREQNVKRTEWEKGICFLWGYIASHLFFTVLVFSENIKSMV